MQQSNKGSILLECISCCLQLFEMNEVFDSPLPSDAVWLSCDYAEWLFQKKHANRGAFQSNRFEAAALSLARWMKLKIRVHLVTSTGRNISGLNQLAGQRTV